MVSVMEPGPSPDLVPQQFYLISSPRPSLTGTENGFAGPGRSEQQCRQQKMCSQLAAGRRAERTCRHLTTTVQMMRS